MAANPSVSWKQPADLSLTNSKIILKDTNTPEIPDASKKWGASELIDIALKNNPETSLAWHNIRASQAQLGSEKGWYYPQIDITTDYSHSRKKTGDSGAITEKSFGPEISLKWLLFDFGERQSQIEQAKYSVFAAGFNHNAMIQKVVLQVVETYLQYIHLIAVEKANLASLADAQKNLEAANERHKEGVATISDVLQAKTSFSQTMLVLQDTRGKILTIKGALATAIGIPANTQYEVEDITPPPSMEIINNSIDVFIKSAMEKRPEIKAQQSLYEKSRANLRNYEAKKYPSVYFDSSLGKRYDEGLSRSNEEYSAIIRVDIPVFKGFSRLYDIKKAKEEEKLETDRLKRLEQQIILEVWSGYNDLNTASQKIHTTHDLLMSAEKSYEVAHGRYQEGVGDILELLAAQKSLESARALVVEAKTQWYISLSRMSFAAGMLWEPGKDIFKD
jgi:outer membrane protein TolC